jgi:uncharacterized protein YeaO (DUF488 family)
MTVLVVRLGSPRSAGEGLRIGTVRRPPRGVPAARFAADDWYDVWFPNLAPSVETMKLGKGAQTVREWSAFAKRFRAEMAEPVASRTLDLLAALSHTAAFSVGCYCEDEARCHRSVLRELLAARGARVGSSATPRAQRRPPPPREAVAPPPRKPPMPPPPAKPPR